MSPTILSMRLILDNGITKDTIVKLRHKGYHHESSSDRLQLIVPPLMSRGLAASFFVIHVGILGLV